MSGEPLEMEAAQTIKTLLDAVVNNKSVTPEQIQSCVQVLDALEENATKFVQGDKVRYTAGNNGVATVLGTLPIEASDLQIKGTDETVAEYHNSAEYNNDAVVVCRFPSGDNHYYFPESTLEQAYPEETETTDESVGKVTI